MRKAARFIEAKTDGTLNLEVLETAVNYVSSVRLLKREAEKVLGPKTNPQEISEVVSLIAHSLYAARNFYPEINTPEWHRYSLEVAGRQPLVEKIKKDFPRSSFAKRNS